LTATLPAPAPTAPVVDRFATDPIYHALWAARVALASHTGLEPGCWEALRAELGRALELRAAQVDEAEVMAVPAAREPRRAW
jgi:hypothetical protein